MSKRFAKEERCAWVVADWLWEEPDFSNIPKDFYTIEPVFTEYCIVVVVSALQAITEEQILNLTSVDISAPTLGESDETDESKDFRSNTWTSTASVVFGSAELWRQKDLLAKMKGYQFQKRVEVLVVDEAYVTQSS